MDERRLTAWLIMQGFLQPDQVKEALEEQLRLKREGSDVDIIEVARRQKLITDVQVLEILEKTGYQPPKRIAAPVPSDEGSVEESVEASGWGSAASGTGSLDSLEEVEASSVGDPVSDEGELTPSMRVPAVDAAAEAKALPAKGAPRARKGMSSASYQAARRRSNSTLQTVLMGGFMLLAGLVILSFVGGGSSSPMTDDRPDVADVKPPTNKKSRADTLLDKLRLGAATKGRAQQRLDRRFVAAPHLAAEFLPDHRSPPCPIYVQLMRNGRPLRPASAGFGPSRPAIRDPRGAFTPNLPFCHRPGRNLR